jgi:hypothetical protein
MSTESRLLVYRRQNGSDTLTKAQARQVRKQDKKLKAAEAKEKVDA